MQPLSENLIPDKVAFLNLDHAIDKLLRPEPPTEWLLAKKHGSLASGFKIMAHQIRALPNSADFWRCLTRQNVKILVVVRNNILAQYISDLIVKKTRQCVCTDGNVKKAKVQVPINNLKSILSKLKEEQEFILRRAECYDHRILRYEKFKDNIIDIESAFEWLVGFPYTLTARIMKQNPDSIADKVTNYDELATEMHRIGLENYLIGG